MFRKWLKVPLFILFVLLIHLFSGQPNSEAAVVLCLGNDGHIALEVAQHQPHVAQISDQPDHPNACPESENCQDILLAFGHQEMLTVPKFKSDILQPFLHSVQDAALIYSFLELQDLSETSIKPISLAELPRTYSKHRASSAQIQTLKHTILTI